MLSVRLASSQARTILSAFAIFLLALLPRLGAIEQYVTPDELHWVDRSLRFSDAMAHGQWADTVQAGHPGVTTMWLGSIGIGLQRLIHPSIQLPDLSIDFDPQNAAAMRALAQFLTSARLPVIITTSLNIALLFLLLRRVIDRRAAFLAAGLIALDPFAVGLGGLLHVDSLLTMFSLASLAALSIAIHHTESNRWLIVSGLLAGLAMLSKSPAIVLAPTVVVVVALNTFRQRRPIRHLVRSMLIWGLSVAFIFIALYPAMWTAPMAALQLMSDRIEKFSETAHAVNYFFGSRDRDPGAWFYPAVLAYRSTPVLWIGLMAALVLIVRVRSDEDQRLRELSWGYWVFAILFVGVITLGAKKLDRYVLPALEALNVVAAFGIAGVIATAMKHRDARSAWVIGSAFAITALPFVVVWPLTLRAYNPLLGGYNGASQALPVGGGESAEVGRALAASPFASDVIATTDIVGTAPFFPGALISNDEAGLAQADDLLFNAADFQLAPDVTRKWIGGAAPVFTVTVQNQPFAWLYPNPWLATDRQRLIDNWQNGDGLIIDYAAALPSPAASAAILLPGHLDESSAIELLSRVAQDHSRVFFFHYSAAPRAMDLLITRLLETHAIKLDEWASPLGDGGLYALPAGTSFNSQPLPLKSNAVFGDRIRLMQAALIAPHVPPGQAIGLYTEWIAPSPEAQAFVSLVDAQGHAWSQIDERVPVVEPDRTQRAKRITVPTPPVIPPGEYQLVLHVVDLDSGKLLAIRTPDNSFGGFEWPLGEVTIDPPQTLIDPATRIPPITLNTAMDGIRAIGTNRPPDPVVAGDPWTLTMDWAALDDQRPALDVRWLVTSNARVVYSTTMPLSSYSTDRWRKGEVSESKYDFRLPITLKDGTYQLEFQIIDHSTGQPLNSMPERLTTINVRSRPRVFDVPQSIGQSVDARFNDLATLIGANLDRSGNSIKVTLYWQANQITATNYTVFVQLVAADGNVVQQIDNWQIGGDAPTSTWVEGQIIADQYTFENVPPGESQVWAGLYNSANGQRLPAFDELGNRLPEDRVLIR